MISDWLSFWDKPHCIYVSARHKDVHYRGLAEAIAALAPSPQARMLDYGCGEALHADIAAAACGELLLCDGAPNVRAGIAARFAAHPKIRTLAPEEVECLPDRSLDLIVLHSVVQYLTGAQTQALFALFRRLLRPDGLLQVSDVIPPQVAASTDVATLIRFATANGFLLAALLGIARTLFSHYWWLRVRLGLTHYSEAEMIDKLGAAGFTARRAAKNMGHDQARMAFLARPK